MWKQVAEPAPGVILVLDREEDTWVFVKIAYSTRLGIKTTNLNTGFSRTKSRIRETLHILTFSDSILLSNLVAGLQLLAKGVRPPGIEPGSPDYMSRVLTTTL